MAITKNDLSREFSISGIWGDEEAEINVQIVVDPDTLKAGLSFSRGMYFCMLVCPIDSIDSMLTTAIDKCVDRGFIPPMVPRFRGRLVAEFDQLVSECHRRKRRLALRTRIIDLATIAAAALSAGWLTYRFWNGD